jgi:hypothetical protein
MNVVACDDAQQIRASSNDNAKDMRGSKLCGIQPTDALVLIYTKRFLEGARHGGVFRFWNHEGLLRFVMRESRESESAVPVCFCVDVRRKIEAGKLKKSSR